MKQVGEEDQRWVAPVVEWEGNIELALNVNSRICEELQELLLTGHYGNTIEETAERILSAELQAIFSRR